MFEPTTSSIASASSTLVTALGPAFAAGFAVQQLLEIVDPIVASRVSSALRKKVITSLVSLALGLGIARIAGLHVLQSLQSGGPVSGDWLVTGIVISAGTEGLNSIVKFLGYAKDAKKADAAAKLADAGRGSLAMVNREAERA